VPNERKHYAVGGYHPSHLQLFVGIREVIRTTLFWIDTLDLAYYTVADGDGQAHEHSEASTDPSRELAFTTGCSVMRNSCVSGGRPFFMNSILESSAFSASSAVSRESEDLSQRVS
jgi:hypothetical protein